MSLVEKTFKNGEVIIKEGDTGSSFFRLLEGSAHVYSGLGKKDQIRLAVLEEGEYFGEMAILEAYPRSASIVAKGSVRVIEIPGDELNSYLAEDPERIIELMAYLGNRVRNMRKDYDEAKALLAQLKESESAKQDKSLFSKIKKHIDIYQCNKNKITRPGDAALAEALAGIKDKAAGKVKSCRKGMFVFREGDESNSMFLLHSGKVGFYKGYRTPDEEKTGEVDAVCFFGEIEMIGVEPRKTTAVIETDDTGVETISPEDLTSIFKSCPVKITMILRHLSYKLRILNIDFLNTCKEITELYNKQ